MQATSGATGGAAPAEGAPALPGQLRLAVLRLSRRMRQESSGQTTPSQLSALTSIAKHGELTLGELAAIEQVAPPSMTRIAGRLEEQGLVARRTDANDRRVARVEVTDAGRQLLTETRHRRDAFLASRLAQLDDDQLDIVASAVPLLESLARD